ncbi:MAG: hypothetical protein ACTSRQ_16225 [Candidatus Thorarchaeota archaeon]
MIFIKWRVSWDDGENKQEAEFWLPKGNKPKVHLGALLNLVELDADDTGYKYDLVKIRERACD